MIARAYTVAFQGVEAKLIEVQCSFAPGIPAFKNTGCPGCFRSSRRSDRPRNR